MVGRFGLIPWWQYCRVKALQTPLSQAVVKERWHAGAWVLGAVVLGHLLLLAWLPLGVGGSFGQGVRPTVQTRQIVLQATARPRVQDVPQDLAQNLAQAALKKVAAASPIPAKTPPLTSNVGVASDPKPTTTITFQAGELALAEPEPAPPPAAIDSGGLRIPTYATQLPTSVVLSYALKRGGLAGTGELVWRPRDGAYTMTLQGGSLGVPLMAWASQGGFDEAGIAPEKFTDRRRSRAAVAAHFQRDLGRITFSGPRTEYPLIAGAQDRLTWLMQVPGIVAAAPQAFGSGKEISVFVVGARGDADVWTFLVEAEEDIDLPAGRVPRALHLLREPRRPYDTRVELWLDPARQYLPVRIRLGNAPNGDPNEFALTAVSTPP